MTNKTTCPECGNNFKPKYYGEGSWKNDCNGTGEIEQEFWTREVPYKEGYYWTYLKDFGPQIVHCEYDKSHKMGLLYANGMPVKAIEKEGYVSHWSIKPIKFPPAPPREEQGAVVILKEKMTDLEIKLEESWKEIARLESELGKAQEEC